jgi:ATP:corrinoid adenosyltransferase
MLVSTEAARPESKKMIVTGDKKARDHATEMLDIITNAMFWHAIAR